METIAENDFGVVIDGKFHKIEWMPELVDSLSKKVMNNIIDQIEDHLSRNPANQIAGERNYKVRQVATMTQKSVATITHHCRIGLLKASKVGKSWLISEENYLSYKNNVYDPNQVIRS